MDKVMTRGQFAQEMLEQMKQGDATRKTLKEHLDYEKDKAYNEEVEALLEGSENARKRQMKLSNFNVLLKENLLHECICTIFDRILKEERATQHEYAIGHSMISKLIKEEGADNLLLRFDCSNLILSEFGRYTEKYHALVVEAVGQKAASNPDDDSCYVFDKEVSQKFMDDVKDITPQNTIDLIRDRVEDAMQSFIDQNTENKIAIKDIYTKTKVSVSKAETDEIKEEYTAIAKGLVEQVYSKPTNVFGAMVNAIGESVLKTPALQKQYMEGTKVNMNRLCDDVRVMYTVLEMANTLNIIRVNEDYIKKVVTDLKEE